MPRHASDLQKLSVQRVLFNGAFGGHRLPHEARGVDDLDGLLRGEPRSDQLASTGEAEHQVLLDKAQGNVKVCRHEPFVDEDRRAALRRTQGAMVLEHLSVMVDDAVLGSDLRSENAVDLLRCSPSMQACSNQDRDTFHRNTSFVQALQQRGQGYAVWRRTGNVADRDRGGTFASS